MPPLQRDADSGSHSDPAANPYASSWVLPPSVPFDDYCSQRQAQHILCAFVIFIAIPLAATAIALHFEFWNGRWTDPPAFAVLLVAVAFTVAAQLVLANFIYSYGPDVVQLLRSRFQEEGIDPDAWDGICVTFSPADRPREFMKGNGSHSVFDAGFVFLFDDALMFLGEKTSFVLPRVSVRSVRLGKGTREIGWFPQRVYIDWFDAESQSVQTFNFGATGGLSLNDSRTRVAPELRDRIRSWHTGDSRQRRGSPSLAAFPPPDPALSANAIPHAQSRSMTLTGLLFLSALAGIVEAGLAWGTGQLFTGSVPLASLLSMCFLCSPMIFSSDPPAEGKFEV